MTTLNEMMAHAHIYDLEQPRYFGAPVMAVHAPGFVYTLHRHHEPGMPEIRTSASGSYYSTEHSGTHIDALCHQAEQMYLYGGREITPKMQTPTGFKELGVETIAPISARGVLLDVARYRGVDCITTDSPYHTGRPCRDNAAARKHDTGRRCCAGAYRQRCALARR